MILETSTFPPPGIYRSSQVRLICEHLRLHLKFLDRNVGVVYTFS